MVVSLAMKTHLVAILRLVALPRAPEAPIVLEEPLLSLLDGCSARASTIVSFGAEHTRDRFF